MPRLFDFRARRASAEAEWRRVEEEVRQKQKMEAIAQLAGGIAHDFNNLLTVIGGNVLLLTSGDLTDEERAYAREISDAAERAGVLTRQLLEFSRKRRMELHPLDLNEALESAEQTLRRLLGAAVEVVVVLERPLPLVLGDAGRVEQILLNLALNAGEAMPEGGTLTITTDVAGGSVRLTVVDTGVGMDEETRERVFEPFFTTKRAGEGTGLGLTTVYGIVRQFGGEIRIDSEVGRGTTIVVTLPAVAGSAPAAERLPVSEPAAVRTGRILVVDDEPAVRRVAGKALTRAGHEALAAGSGLEALELLASGQVVDLLITDLVMPGMDGVELAERACVERPGLPVLFMSGYAGRLPAAAQGAVRPAELLEKPFTPEALVAVVAKTLSAD
jgi:CheY-like chemotaxis protein